MKFDHPTRTLLVALSIVATTALASCGGQAPQATNGAAAPGSAPAPGASTPSAPAATVPVVEGRPMKPSPWFDALPKKQVAFKPGDRVVAAVPDGAAVSVYVGTIKSVEGETATIEIAGTTQLIERAPGALLYALPTGVAKPGDLVAGIQNGSARITPGVAGDPSKDAKPGQIDLHYGEGLGKTSRVACDAVFPLVTGTEPLAFVSFQHPHGRSERGVVIAKAGGKVVVKEDTREVNVVDESAVKPLAIKKSYGVGDKVQAWSYGIGYKPGTVTAVDKPNELYKVKSTRVVDETEDTFYITELNP